MASVVWCLCLLLVNTVFGDYYDTFTGVQITRRRFEEMRNMSLVPWCAIEVAPCEPHEPRRMDLSCNNLRLPSFGAIATPFRRMLPADYQDGRSTVRTAASGRPLPPPRALRVALMSDGRAASHTHTQLLVDIALLNTADTTSVHDTVNYIVATLNCCSPAGALDPRCAPLAVPNDDLHLFPSNVRCLNLTRPISYQGLGCIPNDVPLERFNIAGPMLELSNVYGFEASGAAAGRLWEGGRMRAEMLNGKEWPPSGGGVCVNNEPPNESRCHSAPNAGANSLLGINIVFLWLYRQHNAIARELSALNPCWDDDRIYYTAREINIAFANQIYYYEFLPEIMGKEYLLKHDVISPHKGHVNDYDPTLEPRLSIEYTIASRWFHTLQEGRLKMYTQNGDLYDEKAIVDFTLRTGALAVNGTLQGLTQGSFRQPGAARDQLLDPDMGSRVLGRLQRVSDVVSSDIMKGRLLGLASYTSYRRHCQLTVPNSWTDLEELMEQEQVDALSRQYETVEDIDLLAGMIAELPLTMKGHKRQRSHVNEEEKQKMKRESLIPEKDKQNEREIEDQGLSKEKRQIIKTKRESDIPEKEEQNKKEIEDQGLSKEERPMTKREIDNQGERYRFMKTGHNQEVIQEKEKELTKRSSERHTKETKDQDHKFGEKNIDRERIVKTSESQIREERHIKEIEEHISHMEVGESHGEEEGHKDGRRGEEEALVGPTLACVLAEQLVRFRRADRYWYEYAGGPHAFTKAQLYEIRKMSLAALLCRHGDGVTAVQRRPLRLPSHRNKLEPCASIEVGAPDLAAFADHTCGKHSSRDPFAPFVH